MNDSVKAHVRFQYLMGRFAIFITGPLIYLLIHCVGYRIRHLEQIRETVKRMYRRHPGPWLICANHLTLIDSVIIAYAMAPCYKYMIHYHQLPWNMPEKKNFNKNIVISLLTFVCKCIPVIRKGDRASVAKSLAKCEFLLEKNESLMIFPEGTRSRSGRIDPHEYSYGVGRLLSQIPDCNVMCIYLRGLKQNTFSRVPAFRQEFNMAICPITPQTRHKGLRAQRDYSRQIIETLIHMENHYVDGPGK
ncbi:MAG: 1-acyl-sn-glycerol-3-phosphate acyltransferase [Proteobacteria bacterium]|nr:1-acyl-sn-glycerol-3-phosphate acyltransferase [Pseudomonadota bacterium]